MKITLNHMSLTLCLIVKLNLIVSQSISGSYSHTVRGNSSTGVEEVNSSCVILKVIYDLSGMDLDLYSGEIY